jgi:2-succinyl-5-enolpyruvyl-6-hydroxy-3-cyclohexene-1-carboxylate synthase
MNDDRDDNWIPDHLARSNPSSFFGAMVAEGLFRMGVTDVIVCPGSRSTPLTLALAQHPGISARPVLDERCAAFVALGIARIQRKPVALVCTSGSALAHFYPALIEAKESRVPLIVLTADRPPEARHCHSGQTIDQLKIFGDIPVFFAELAVPEWSFSVVRHWRQLLSVAVEKSQYPFSGPVHLNIPFRDPLSPEHNPKNPCPWGTDEISGLVFRSGSFSIPKISGKLPDKLPSRGLVIFGTWMGGNLEASIQGVLRLVQHTGWTLLVDALGPWRSVPEFEGNRIAHYDLILRNTQLRQDLAPAAVMCIGQLPTSKILRDALQEWNAPMYWIDPSGENWDALQLNTQRIISSVSDIELPTTPVSFDSSYSEVWRDCESRIIQCLHAKFSASDRLFEGSIARLLPDLIPEGSILCVANSMPVRDLEFFWTGNTRSIHVVTNRGANGIDGTLASAIGVSLSLPDHSVYLLTGDLALLHDMGSFQLLKEWPLKLTIIVLNNRGGRIFENLPVAGFNPPFERFFVLPHAFDFEGWAAFWKIPFTRISQQSELSTIVPDANPSGVRLVEVVCDSAFDGPFRKELLRIGLK